MVVYEVGLITNGLPVITQSYHETIRGDSIVRSGFFTALQSFAEEAFADITEEFKMRKYVVYLKRTDWGKEVNTTSILYALCSKESRSGPIKQCLNSLSEKINEYDYPVNGAIDTSIFAKLKPVIDEIFEDQRHRPYDRAKKLFG